MIEEHPDPQTPAKSRRAKTALLISVFAHLVLFGYLLFRYLPSAGGGKTTGKRETIQSDSSAGGSKPAPPAEATVSDDQIKKSLDSQLEQVDKLSDEQKLSELERNLKRLNSFDSGSVVETGNQVAETLGIDTQQYADRPQPAKGSFDPDTAQLKDVKRSKDSSGEWVYESLLVDSEGREMRVPMTAEEGETVYKTFQTMKRFPMAQGLYKSVVMPLMQKMMAAKDAAKSLERAAEQLQEDQ